jgi:hypothetical protein
MNFECSACNKSYQIPDEKLPAKKEIAFLHPEVKAIV